MGRLAHCAGPRSISTKVSLHIKGQRTEGRRGTKNRHDLRLPLSSMAIAIIKKFPRRPGRDLIFGIGPNGLRRQRCTKDASPAQMISSMESMNLLVEFSASEK